MFLDILNAIAPVFWILVLIILVVGAIAVLLVLANIIRNQISDFRFRNPRQRRIDGR